MTMDKFVALIELKAPPAPQDQLETFEVELGSRLPDDYRHFLARTNGGVIHVWSRFKGRKPLGEIWSAFIRYVVHHITDVELNRYAVEKYVRLRSPCCVS